MFKALGQRAIEEVVPALLQRLDAEGEEGDLALMGGYGLRVCEFVRV